MKLIYAPKDGEPQEFTFSLDNIGALEADALEEVGGTKWDTFLGWVDLFGRGSFHAWRAALWLCIRRTDPGFSFRSLDTMSTVELLIQNDDAPEPEGKDEAGDEPTSSA